MGQPQHPPGRPYPPRRYPPHPQYPGYPPQPPPQPFWQRQVEAAVEHQLWYFRHWKIFLPIAVFLVTGLVVMGILVTRAHEASDRRAAAAFAANTATPLGTVTGFLTELAEGDNDDMYGYLCSATQRAYPLSDFRAYRGKQKVVESARLGAEKPVRTPSAASAASSVPWGTIDATLHFVDGSTEKHVFQIVTDDGGRSYRICGDPY